MSCKRNMEIKACVKNIDDLLEKVKHKSDSEEQILFQEDYFFNASQGRLKLRIIQGDKAQLISYERSDKAGPKLSKYAVATCDDAENLKTVLSMSLGIKGSVKKIRHLFFISNTRIHVDKVENLGNFIEFEVVLDENQSEVEGKAIADDLMKLFDIQESDLISGEERSLMVIVLDVHPCQKIITNHQHRFHQVLEALIAFSNGHLLMKPDNKLAIIACHSGTSDFIFADKDYAVTPTGINDGQYELFAHVEKCIRKNIKEFLSKMVNGLPEGESLLAGACGMALCYINRMTRELPIGDKMNSRILVITGSADSASQYMNYMNVFFTAQKENVVIDVCTLEHDQGLLQQGCDITGGAYLKTPQQQGLLQYLMWVFLPEPPLRKKLVLPPPVKVDYRAACFCHRQLIDIGYVCSICLSIFCKFSPICTTCHALFKTPGPPPSKPKKKKPKML